MRIIEMQLYKEKVQWQEISSIESDNGIVLA